MRADPVRVGGHVVVEGVVESGHVASLGAFLRRVGATRGLAEDLVRLPACLLGGHGAEAADGDALVGRLPAAVAGTVVDDEGLGPPAGWMRTPKPVSLSSQAIQEGVGGPKRLHGSLVERCAHPGGCAFPEIVFMAGSWHGISKTSTPASTPERQWQAARGAASPSSGTGGVAVMN